jgi:hypothetical protein
MNTAFIGYSNLSFSSTTAAKYSFAFPKVYFKTIFNNQNQFFNQNQFSIMKTKTNTQVWFMSLVLVLMCAFGATAQHANLDPNNTVVITPEGVKPYAPVKKDGSVVGQTATQPEVLTPELSAKRQQAGFPVAFSEQTKQQMANGVQNLDAVMNAFAAQFKEWQAKTENWESYMSREEMNFINKGDLASLWKYNYHKFNGSNSSSH